ncbi:phage tail protein [Serratia sp. IR-2025]|uniref:phage tail protein n=1 Tax=Serratia TaxID=613 RepID=UPI002179031A|nr:phage tail protein [Serratia marcescens]CAI2140403.1 P2 phage tail completion protein R (GpR) [Serratia marcescens]
MSQLSDLTAFMAAHLPPRVQTFASWMDNQKLTPALKNLGKGQRRIGITTYDGVLEWDKYPFRELDPAVLFALVLSWLMEGANEARGDLNLSDPDVDIEMYDEESALVTITIPLVDEIVLLPNKDGEIPLDGQAWGVVDAVYDHAQEAVIFGADATGAPVKDGDDR